MKNRWLCEIVENKRPRENEYVERENRTPNKLNR